MAKKKTMKHPAEKGVSVAKKPAKKPARPQPARPQKVSASAAVPKIRGEATEGPRQDPDPEDAVAQVPGA